jgi:hypothetical protein
MSGQLVIVLVPSANNVAAISLSTLFLAPPTATCPANRLPPVTTKRSATRVSLVKWYRLVSQPRSDPLTGPVPFCSWQYT